jgi:transposase, IS6 family
LSAKRDAEAAKRFFRKALAQPHTVNPRTITVDKNAAYPKAATEMKKDGELWRRSRLRQVKYLNNIVEQDHRRVKRLTGPAAPCIRVSYRECRQKPAATAKKR